MHEFWLNIIRNINAIERYGLLILVCVVWILVRRRKTVIHHMHTMTVAIVIFWLSLFGLYGIALWSYFAKTSAAAAFLPPSSVFLYQQVSRLVTAHLSYLVVAAIILFSSWYIFVIRGRQLMADINDVVLLSLMTMIVGWPSALILFAIIFFVIIVITLARLVLGKTTLQSRMSITEAIIPSTIITLIFQNSLLAITHLEKIRF